MLKWFSLFTHVMMYGLSRSTSSKPDVTVLVFRSVSRDHQCVIMGMTTVVGQDTGEERIPCYSCMAFNFMHAFSSSFEAMCNFRFTLPSLFINCHEFASA